MYNTHSDVTILARQMVPRRVVRAIPVIISDDLNRDSDIKDLGNTRNSVTALFCHGRRDQLTFSPSLQPHDLKCEHPFRVVSAASQKWKGWHPFVSKLVKLGAITEMSRNSAPLPKPRL